MRCIEGIRAMAVAALSAGAGVVLWSCAVSSPPRVPGGLATAPGSMDVAGQARTWEEFKVLAARRLVAANPSITYLGPPPEVLLAIPVLEVELNADGAVEQVRVLRYPRQALDTVQLAVDAVRRAAPFGSVRHLPRPWKYTETFLFDDARHFKPRTLEE